MRFDRAVARWILAVAFAAGLPLGLAPASCTTDAVGVDACREIETARCEAARQCGYDDDQVTACTEFYRDQCLLGIQNDSDPENPPSEAQVNGCVSAVQAVATCAQSGTPMSACGAQLDPTAAARANPYSLTACNVIRGLVQGATTSDGPFGVELLAACTFVVKPATGGDAGTGTTDAGDGGSTSDASDDAEPPPQ